jgi:hypothetical protein
MVTFLYNIDNNYLRCWFFGNRCTGKGSMQKSTTIMIAIMFFVMAASTAIATQRVVVAEMLTNVH